MKLQSKSDFTDTQVKLLISKNPDCNYMELVKRANKMFPMFKWNYLKIYNSVNRIKPSGKLEIFEDIIKITRNDKIVTKKRIKRIRMLILNGKSRRLCEMEKS